MIDTVEFFATGIVEVAFRDCFFIKINDLIRGKNHRRAVIEHAIVHKSFDDQFYTDSIQITTGNAYNGFISIHGKGLL